MPKKNLQNIKLHKHTLFLREGDIEKLQELYPQVSAAVVIRGLIANHIEKMKQATDKLPYKGALNV